MATLQELYDQQPKNFDDWMTGRGLTQYQDDETGQTHWAEGDDRAHAGRTRAAELQREQYDFQSDPINKVSSSGNYIPVPSYDHIGTSFSPGRLDAAFRRLKSDPNLADSINSPEDVMKYHNNGGGRLLKAKSSDNPFEFDVFEYDPSKGMKDMVGVNSTNQFGAWLKAMAATAGAATGMAGLSSMASGGTFASGAGSFASGISNALPTANAGGAMDMGIGLSSAADAPVWGFSGGQGLSAFEGGLVNGAKDVAGKVATTVKNNPLRTLSLLQTIFGGQKTPTPQEQPTPMVAGDLSQIQLRSNGLIGRV